MLREGEQVLVSDQEEEIAPHGGRAGQETIREIAGYRHGSKIMSENQMLTGLIHRCIDEDDTGES